MTNNAELGCGYAAPTFGFQAQKKTVSCTLFVTQTSVALFFPLWLWSKNSQVNECSTTAGLKVPWLFSPCSKHSPWTSIISSLL